MAVDIAQLKKDVEEAKRLRGQERARKGLGDVGRNYFRRKAGLDEKTSSIDPDLDDDVTRKQKLLDDKEGLSGEDEFKVSDKYVGENDEILYTKKGEPGFFLADKTAYTGKTKRYEKKKEEKVKEEKLMVGWKVSKVPGALLYQKGTKWLVQVGANELVPYNVKEHGNIINEKGELQKSIATSNQEIKEQGNTRMNQKDLDQNVKTYKKGLTASAIPEALNALSRLEKLLPKKAGKDISGTGQWSSFWSKFGLQTEEGSQMRATMDELLSIKIKRLSGAAASDAEVERIRAQFQTSWKNNDKEFINGIVNYVKALKATLYNEIAGVNPQAVKEYEKRNPGDNIKAKMESIEKYFIKYKKDYDYFFSGKKGDEPPKGDKKEEEKTKYKTGQIVKRQGKWYVRTVEDKWKPFSTEEEAKRHSRLITGQGGL